MIVRSLMARLVQAEKLSEVLKCLKVDQNAVVLIEGLPIPSIEVTACTTAVSLTISPSGGERTRRMRGWSRYFDVDGRRRRKPLSYDREIIEVDPAVPLSDTPPEGW